jgi:hypothetical protein
MAERTVQYASFDRYSDTLFCVSTIAFRFATRMVPAVGYVNLHPTSHSLPTVNLSFVRVNTTFNTAHSTRDRMCEVS